MGTTRKRKTPVTSSRPSASASSSKPEASRSVIRKYHVLLRKQSALEAHPTSDKKDIQNVRRQLDQLGGLENYQRMSAIGQGNDRGGGSEKVAISWLKEILKPPLESPRRDRLLEVGALKPDNYSPCRSWIDTTPIDLHSRHPDILEQDFLLMDQAENQERWDIISLSLVLNFVPDARDRGQMLRLAHQFLVPEGLLFLALPLPCVSNSRYLTVEHLTALMAAAGFQQLKERWKAGGKMIYLLYTKTSATDSSLDLTKKTVLRTGANRNNFCILL
ncbi:25S rRNA adenine-N(1) methyltransferase [Mycena chlorophos]|uniref:25S rRNA adenine-N(1) methyltransferase n=1 Tax=Mycena chlorophos TaxID=658473 RepID=A0A8H6TRZ6_MYCCL|nr:25S rRNA adenine-N(1) methyltransferase [Mycena chlorophos]